MGFFDNIFKRGKAYPAKVSPKKVYQGGQEPLLACELTIDGGKYMLDEFDIDFDSTGSKRYMTLYAMFPEKLSPALEAWITRESIRRDGVVKFYRNVDSLDEGAVFTLTFYDAVCVRYRRSAHGDRPSVTLLLTTKHIRLLGEEYEIK